MKRSTANRGRMRLLTAILLPAVIASFETRGSDASATIFVADRELTLPIPAGSCRLDPGSDVDRRRIEVLQGSVGQARILLVTVPCGQESKLDGPIAALSDDRAFTILIYGAQRTETGAILPQSLDRRNLVRRMAANARGLPAEGTTSRTAMGTAEQTTRVVFDGADDNAVYVRGRSDTIGGAVAASYCHWGAVTLAERILISAILMGACRTPDDAVRTDLRNLAGRIVALDP